MCIDSRITIAGLALSCAGFAQAQAVVQKVTGPQARYWISAETSTGLMSAMTAGGGGAGGGLGGLGALMGMARGAVGGPQRTLRLDLGANREQAEPAADHAIPAAMGMGASLPLLGPERGTAVRGERGERDVPEHKEADGNMRLLFFWGCGETVSAGQPVVLDMKSMLDGKVPPNLQSFVVNAGPQGPASGRDRSFAQWPNRRDSQAVPAGASLVGEHQVRGNFTPDIRFDVAVGHDFMDGLSLQTATQGSGALQLRWNAPATAIGYFSTALGFRSTGDKSGDMVLWNSSAKRMLGGERLMNFLPPAEVARLQREGVVLPASQTECQVPKAVLEAAGGNLAMVHLNAFGPELNVVHPPRPEDPKIDWNQEYVVKLRQRAFTSSIPGMADIGAARRAPARAPAAGDERAPAPADAAPAVPKVPGMNEAIEGGAKLLKGLFGR